MTILIRHIGFLFFAVGSILLLFTGVGDLSLDRCDSKDQLSDPIPASLGYYTKEMPPYSYLENGTLAGISIDLLESVTQMMGDKVSREKVHLLPLDESYQQNISKNNTVLLSIERTPENEQSFKWTGPICTVRWVLFAKKDRRITIQSSHDLLENRIGVIANDALIQRLINIGVSHDNITVMTDVFDLIGKLEVGEIDLWASCEAEGRYFAQKTTGNYYSYEVVYSLDVGELYYGFSKDVPDCTVKSFQQALDSLEEERDGSSISQYEQILGRYIPAIGLEHLNYLTEEWAPFNYKEDGNATGISVEFLEAVFRHLGVKKSRADVRIVPLAEGFQAARNETRTVLFAIVRTHEREPLYKWAGPFTKASFVLYAPMSRNITIDSPEDLNRYRIGAVQDSIENPLLIKQGVSQSHIVNGKTPQDLLRMLEEGEIDIWATGDLAGRHQMLKTAGDPNAYEIVYTLSENDFYFIFCRDVPDILVSAFQHSLDAVRNERDELGVSEYERIIYKYLGAGCARQTFGNDAVIELVNFTARSLEENAPDTLRRINAQDPPYRNLTNPGLYTFIYTMNLTMAAHADNIMLVGGNYKGKTDVTGNLFHDQILQGALKNQTGWVDYVYMHPVQTNLYYKTTYYRLTRGSDGIQYIVCSGNYKRCD